MAPTLRRRVNGMAVSSASGATVTDKTMSSDHDNDIDSTAVADVATDDDDGNNNNNKKTSTTSGSSSRRKSKATAVDVAADISVAVAADHDLKKELVVVKNDAADNNNNNNKSSSATSTTNTSDSTSSTTNKTNITTPVKSTSTTATPTKAIISTAADIDASFHYYVFSLLFMIGFMLHSRKYYDWNCRLTMIHITSYILCPIPFTSTKFTSKSSSSVYGSSFASGRVRDRVREIVFLSFLCLCIWSTYDESPFNANHHNVMGFISVLLLPNQLRRVWNGPTQPTSIDSTAHALNHVRCAIVIMYLFAGFHKINTDFLFHPKVSCAYDMLWDYLNFFDIYEPEDLEQMPTYLKAMPYLGLIIELVPPIMLCFQSTQMYGVLLLVKLHWMLLPVGFADFGSIAQSFLWLFVAADKSTKALPHHLYGQMAGYLVFFEAITFFLWYHSEEEKVPLKNEEATIVFSTFSIVWWNILRVGGLSGVPMRLPKSIISRGALLAFIFFALNPYFGLRTVGTLAMFSNLRTEVRPIMIASAFPFLFLGFPTNRPPFQLSI
jgi:hypothetical protein